MATEGLRKELAEVSAKSQAAAKRKMAGVPLLSKVELLKVRTPSSSGCMQVCWPYPHCCGAEQCRPTSTCRASGTRTNSQMSLWMIWPR